MSVRRRLRANASSPMLWKLQLSVKVSSATQVILLECAVWAREFLHWS